MAIAHLNGIQLSHYDQGTGEPVVLVMGTGAGANGWNLHQVPALLAAGYRVITFDNRGIAPSSVCPEGFGAQDMVDDILALLDHLELPAANFVGTSLGAHLVQELALQRPEKVTRAVLMASRGRSDAMRDRLSRAELRLADSAVVLPPDYRAAVRALQVFSPATLGDDERVNDWLDVLELSQQQTAGVRAQMAIEPGDRLAAYRDITVACHVIAFADDLITTPGQGRELADSIPGATFELLADCGHYGYLEQPDAVNKSVIEFLRRPE
ncbi:alpha/beta hydrolase [Streptomyces sp. CS149]|uniref:alpha/beta fold hydrolase n=1 Tax=Streptomyces TaxID=1883 RepID=UPI000D1B722A|nr:alpha/beta hydrolase [Streptomyces sp. CS149]MCC8482395.1 alpha/beta hydrolase [Streptomyces globisporus]PSK69608.1 alpha/beta hydrolase [Streptomyces sp. CS149]